MSLALFLPFTCLGSTLQMDSVILDSLYTQGRAHFDNSNFSLALPYYLKVDSLARKHNVINPTSINAILDRSEISRVTFTYEGVEMAHDLQLEALHLSQQIENAELIHNIYVRLADMHGLKGNNDSMRYYLDPAFSYYKIEDNIKLLSRIYLIYMTHYYATGKLDSAGINLAEGLAYLRTKGDPKQLAPMLFYYGRHFSYKLDDCKQGLPYLIEALEIFENEGDTLISNYIFLNEELGLCYANLKNYEAAYERFKKGFYAKYALDRKENNELTRTLETKYQAREREKEIELLTAKNALAEQEQQNQFFILFSLIALAIVVAVVFYILYKNRQKVALRLKEVDKLKSNFFANISHEFRTPITLIKGPIEDQLSREALDQKSESNLLMANRNVDRLLSLVDQLLDLSKLEAGSMYLQVAEGSAFSDLRIMTSSFNYLADQKSIEYEVEIPSDQDESWYDKDALEKITFNLLSNAIKYTPEHGKISFEAKLSNDQLYISVKNTGQGMNEEDVKNVLKRFYQANTSHDGVGIGLALVNELITLHKGTLVFSSERDAWTQFKVQLPVTRSAFKKEELISGFAAAMNNGQGSSVENLAAEVSSPLSEEAEIDEEKPILLIVDDNADIRSLINDLFIADYHVIQAENGEGGISMAIETVPDIIISDVMMPVKDGVELSKTLKADERTSHIPIILLTAKADEENKLIGLETGADDYIIKPFSNELLKVRINKLIELRNNLRQRYSQEVVLRPKDIAISSTDENFLERIQSLLDKKLDDPTFNAGTFSAEMGMSRMQLHRKLKALVGLATTEFIRSQRLKLAAHLLQNNGANVSEIGYAVGFSDPSYFAKCFKAAYDRTPSQFKEELSNKES